METLGVVLFLPAGFCLSTSGWQTRAGTCSPGAAGFCPRFIFRETLPQSDSSGPRAESRLLLEVIPSSQHLPLSFPPPQNWVRCQLSLSPSLPGVTTSQLGVFIWGRHQEPEAHKQLGGSGTEASTSCPCVPGPRGQRQLWESTPGYRELDISPATSGQSPCGEQRCVHPTGMGVFSQGFPCVWVVFSGAGSWSNPGFALGWVSCSTAQARGW